MKLSKKLLSTLVIGIAIVGGSTSCEKKTKVQPKLTNDSDVVDSTAQHAPNYCPACGMG